MPVCIDGNIRQSQRPSPQPFLAWGPFEWSTQASVPNTELRSVTLYLHTSKDFELLL